MDASAEDCSESMEEEMSALGGEDAESCCVKGVISFFSLTTQILLPLKVVCSRETGGDLMRQICFLFAVHEMAKCPGLPHTKQITVLAIDLPLLGWALSTHASHL
jgi:hypothetical protein